MVIVSPDKCVNKVYKTKKIKPENIEFRINVLLCAKRKYIFSILIIITI